MLYQDNYFAASVKLNFCYRQTPCIDDQDKVQYVTGTDNEFTECQTPKKKLQSIFISPATLHAFMNPSIETHLAVVRGLPANKFLPKCVNKKRSSERRYFVR